MIAALLAGAPCASPLAHAQSLAPLSAHVAADANWPEWADSLVVITPGARYARQGWSRVLLGDRYRDLWNTPIRVPVLSLARFAGGLTPLRAHVGSQTRSLRFAAGDGRTYQFRAIEKDPTARLAEELRLSVAGTLLQDGVSSSHPAASLVASALLQAADVLHVTQVVTVMPDDPTLGEHRAAFAGVLGMLEERPDDTDDPRSSFGGGGRVISPERLFERLDRRPSERVDARAFLRARLVDILMGDRDRHRDQFRWLARDSAGITMWQPISRDHDEAFVKIDGAALAIIRLYYHPLVTFGAAYPAHDKLNWHAREIDRRFLAGLERPAWDSTARGLQAALSDAVIAEAVHRMPAEMVAVGGEALARTLRLRRDALIEEARSYYTFLARQVELRGTERSDVAVVTPIGPDSVEVVLRAGGDASGIYLHRRFDRHESRELRLYMWGGRDSVIVGRLPAGAPLLRVVGGQGADLVLDSATAGRVRIYDAGDATTVWRAAGPATYDDRPYPEWIGSDLDRYPPRDWGSWLRPIPVLGATSDLGVLVGGGVLVTRYGFRAQPYAAHMRATLAYSTAVASLRAALDADLRRPNSDLRLGVHALASGLEFLRYFGQGNDTPNARGRAFHTVRQTTLIAEPRLSGALGTWGRWSLGPSGRWTRTAADDGRFVAQLSDSLYGAGAFGLVGAGGGVERDTRDAPAAPTRGGYFRLDVRGYPALWNARHPFAVTQLDWRAYRTLSGPWAPSLALRLGGQYNAGRHPFQESAFIGGERTVRGLHQQRYAGDASAFGSVETRLTGGAGILLLPVRWGGYAGLDAGRVWVDRASPGGWHTAVAVGAWLSVLERSNTIRAGLARSRERLAVEAGMGLAF